MKKVYVIGGEQTDFERNWKKEGKGFVALLRESIEECFNATNFSYEDVKILNEDNRVGTFIGNFDGEQYFNQGHLGAFLTEIDASFYGVPSARYEAACASGSVAIDSAMTKILAGDYDVALVIGLELMKTVDSKTGGDFLGTAAYYEKEAKGIELPFPKLFANLADEMVIKYKLDTDRFMDNLGEISYINYSNAKNNPKAQTRNWFMERKQACSRNTSTNPIVGGKLAISDCSQITDGAAAVILASEDYTKTYCKKNNIPIDTIPYIKGWGHRVAPIQFKNKIKDSIDSPYILKWTRQAVLDAYKRSKLTTHDIDFFETHDCFTSSEFAAISCFGLTEPGKEYEAIESGLIGFDGDKPINPSGGLIGCGHPVGATGVRMLLDLYKQLTNKAGSYQVKKSNNGLMLNIGGSATTNYVYILGK